MLVIAAAIFVHLHAFAQIPPPAPGTNGVPYVRLFNVIFTSAQARPVNNLATTDRERVLSDLTRWYVHFHGDSTVEFPFGEGSKGPLSANTTLAERLTARGAIVSNYRNGLYVTPALRGQPLFGEAADLEAKAPLAIATWWPGQRFPQGEATNVAARLAVALDGTATTVLVASAAKIRPPGAPDTWPYLPSRGRSALPGNARSESTADLVSWVRVDDEILRVRSVTAQGNTISLGVDRAYFGTTKATHTNGTRVFSPVYVGSTAAELRDRGVAGSPPINNAQYALRYGVKIWQDSAGEPLKDAVGWLAGRISTTFGAGKPAPYFQGYNAVWLDGAGCAVYNFADAYGQPVAPWNDARDYAMTTDSLGEHQGNRLRALKARLTGQGMTNLLFIANNLGGPADATADCRARLLANGGFDGGVFERWLRDGASWDFAMNQHLAIQAQDLPAIYWLKWNEFAPSPAVPQYRRFAYGSYLLGWRPTATRPRIGGPFGLIAPEEMFFWNFGAPERQPATTEELLVQLGTRTTGGPVRLHRRDFANGVVIVNRSTDRVRCDLRGEFLDLVNKDPKGKHSLVTAIELGPSDAAFLMKPKGK